METKDIIHDMRKDWHRYNTLSQTSKEFGLSFAMISDYLAEKIELYSKKSNKKIDKK